MLRWRNVKPLRLPTLIAAVVALAVLVVVFKRPSDSLDKVMTYSYKAVSKFLALILI